LVTPNQARVAQPRYYISRRIPFRVQGTSRFSRERYSRHDVRKSFAVVTAAGHYVDALFINT